MVELIGIGVRDRTGWRVRRVTARLNGGTIVALVSDDARERNAVADAVVARTLPVEGRVWIDRIPVMRDTVRRIRARVADISSDAPLAEERSVLDAVAAPVGARSLLRLLGTPRVADRAAAAAAIDVLCLGHRATSRVAELWRADRVRVHVARALARSATCVVIRDPLSGLRRNDAAELLRALRAAARVRRSTILLTHDHDDELDGLVDRVLWFSDGRLAGDRSAGGLDGRGADVATAAP